VSFRRADTVRHGLTAETVIGTLEDAEDYKAFEAVIIADYDVQSAVERELVLRLASLLWRLRRATTMETGLFEIQADYVREFRQGRQTQIKSRETIYAQFERADPWANLPNFALDRLSRYEATLWRQAGQILFALDALDRRKPQDRGRRFRVGRRQELPTYERDEC
jgi:hypothetical protein